MRFSKVTRIVIASAVVSTLVGGIAEVSIANAGMRAGIRSIAASTALTIKRTPGGKVDKGTIVTFKGVLASPAGECVGNQKISLFKGSKKVASGKTKGSGSYAIKKKVTKKKTWHTEFPGSATGVHPNDVTCFASSSGNITIKVGH